MEQNLTLYVPSQEEIEIQQFKERCIFWFEGCLVPVLGSIGIVGNIICILVLTRRDLDLKTRFINLIITLCVFDMLFIISVNLFYTVPIHSDYYHEYLIPYLTPALLPLVHIALTGSVYSVMAVAAERYLIICRHWGDNGKGGGYISSIVVFSLLYNINKFFEVSFEYATYEIEVFNTTSNSYILVNETKAVVTITSLRDNADYTKAIIFINFAVMVVVPLLFLSFCHYFTYKAIRENTKRHNAISSHQRRDNAMAMLFFIIISFFILCHSGKFVLNFFEIFNIFANQKDEEWPLWAFVLTRINHLMLVLNSSVNLFIYCVRDAKFRNATISLFRIRKFMRFRSNANLHTEMVDVATASNVHHIRARANEDDNGNNLNGGQSKSLLQSGEGSNDIIEI